MTATATLVKGIRTVKYIPSLGEHQLSINLGLADHATVFEFARTQGFVPEIVQISTVQGLEIHALLLSERVDQSPLNGSNLSEALDYLADKINADAIRHVYGRFTT
ncbi:hypothetical protein [Stenomitos frigidus]|uniref:Uncharacterized protein n=1 Tax=Stenomitos frigidus ULC18 TaxID=2107698 RepID=A0A2T1EMF4_9CYAN|nr:hypothetical protein [Stenomitos frigidus]PSB33930.1 hypothetical protein C7B82_03445 [Stenomitos frigidus ULC18]